MSQFDREELSNPQKTELRRGLTNGAIAKAMQTEIDVMRSAIAKIRQLLLIQGLCVTDVFHELKRETSFTAEETLIAPRVRTDERRGTPNFYWERTIRHAYPLGTTPIAKREGRARNYQTFVRRHGSKTKTKMHVYLLSKHVPLLKKTQSVSMKEFSQEPEWFRRLRLLLNQG